MTVAIYQKIGLTSTLRIGTFTVCKYTSVRAIGERFLAKHPNFDASSLMIARRSKIMGRWVDDTPISFEESEAN